MIGESRARSLLLDRFWILERSIDIHGADLIIQRRITTQNVLDQTPPRFGVVQAKFYESNATTQYIAKEYLLDATGARRSEFFILCFTGFEESQSIAFLTSDDVLRNFRDMPRDHSRVGHFELPWKTVFAAKYLVVSQRIMLDQIERTLEYADISSNRQFVLNGLRSVSLNPHTDPGYELPLDNPHASIPEEFYDFKKRANSARYAVEDFISDLDIIMSTSNPEVALAAAIRLREQGYQLSVKDAFYGEHFEDAITYHREVCEALTKLGSLDAYLELQRQVNAAVIRAAIPALRMEKDATRVLSVQYDPVTLNNVKIEVHVDDLNSRIAIPDRDDVFSSVPGKIVVFSAKAFVVTRRRGRNTYEDADLSPDEHARRSAWILSRPFMHEVFRHLTGEYPFE